MSTAIIGISETLTAFNGDDVVGTKINGVGSFLHILAQVIKEDGGKSFENENPKYAGSGFLTLPSDSFPLVRCGVALQEGLTAQDKHIKEYRGSDQLFALPSKAAPIESVKVLVYLIDKYLNDPDVKDNHSECQALIDEKVTHVIVAVHAGPASFSSHRLIRNIAGGNQDFVPFTKLDAAGDLVYGPGGGGLENDAFLLHTIITEAKATVEFEKKWIVVADRGARADLLQKIYDELEELGIEPGKSLLQNIAKLV